MEEPKTTFTYESLGTLFRKIRMERSLDVSEVAQETRIPPETVRAIEADDYGALPALAFARGFYSLYAKMLGLDQEEILKRFSEERKNSEYEPSQRATDSPQWHGKDIGSIAERPSHSAGPIISISLLVVVLTAAGISWYAGYNPAKQISNWLRSFQQPEVEVVIEQAPEPAETQPEVKFESDQQASPPIEEVPSTDTVLQAPAEPFMLPAEEAKYQLVAEFQDPAEIVLTLDEQTPENIFMTGGSIETWQADEKIVLELPPDTTVRLYLNGIVMPLPSVENGKITVAIPDYFLE